MDIKEFIKTTLSQIVEGVAEAQSTVAPLGGIVSPAMASGITEHTQFLGLSEGGSLVFAIDFDVAVTVNAAEGTKAGAKLEVMSLVNLGAGGESSKSSQSMSRVKFRVPLALPVDSATKAAQADRIEKQNAQVARHNRGGNWVKGYDRQP